MYDLIKRSYLLGLGVLTLTRERIEEAVDDLVKRGEVAEKDRRQVLDRFVERAREEQGRLTDTIKVGVEKVIHEMGLPTRKEYDDLAQRLEQLEKQKPKRKRGGTSRDPDAKTSKSP
jgi:polyhydroxyalkanoate synthesis regulator phasin